MRVCGILVFVYHKHIVVAVSNDLTTSGTFSLNDETRGKRENSALIIILASHSQTERSQGFQP